MDNTDGGLGEVGQVTGREAQGAQQMVRTELAPSDDLTRRVKLELVAMQEKGLSVMDAVGHLGWGKAAPSDWLPLILGTECQEQWVPGH